jgi:uncharacterized membrane protein HdeD (DUF308 family)
MRHWWAVFLLGVLSIIGGIIVLVWPGSGVVALSVILGIFLLMSGVGELWWATRESPGTKGRAWLFALGAIDVVGGLIAVTWPGITALALALVIGVYLLFSSGGMLAYAFSGEQRAREHRTGFLLAALGLFVGGVISIAWPGITVLVIALLFGVVLVYRGMALLYVAMGMRRLQSTAAPR